MPYEKCPKCGKMSLIVNGSRYAIVAQCKECDYHHIQGVL